jgi:hypothetical protein
MLTSSVSLGGSRHFGPNEHVPNEVFEEAHRHFNNDDLGESHTCVVAITGWNRLNIAFRTFTGNVSGIPRRRIHPAAYGPSGQWNSITRTRLSPSLHTARHFVPFTR